MNRHQRKYLGRAQARERSQRFDELLDQVGSPNEKERALAVRSLCPCRGPWPDTIWQHIAAACEDPSPLVRLQALHVLEDTDDRPPHPTAYRLLRKASLDSDPVVAGRAAEYLKQFRLREIRKQKP